MTRSTPVVSPGTGQLHQLLGGSQDDRRSRQRVHQQIGGHPGSQGEGIDVAHGVECRCRSFGNLSPVFDLSSPGHLALFSRAAVDEGEHGGGSDD